MLQDLLNVLSNPRTRRLRTGGSLEEENEEEPLPPSSCRSTTTTGPLLLHATAELENEEDPLSAYAAETEGVDDREEPTSLGILTDPALLTTDELAGTAPRGRTELQP